MKDAGFFLCGSGRMKQQTANLQTFTQALIYNRN